MLNTITVDFDAKSQRLVMKAGFHLLDVMRSFPSRRFDPKTKTWKMPLVKQNVLHWESMKGQYDWDLSVQAMEAIEDLEKLTAKPVYAEVPRNLFQGLPFQPLEHQWTMMDRGWNLPSYGLFAAMGTGKTFVTVMLAMMRFRTSKIQRLAVVCPQTLRSVWRREFEKYAPGLADIRDHVGDKRGHKEWCAERSGKLKVLLVSVEGMGVSEKMANSVYDFFIGECDTMIVCDESSRIKNPDALRTQRVIEFGRHCKYKMILNGTPIALGIQDLWSQYEFLEPNIIGSGDYWAFKTRYVVMGGYENKQIIGYSKVEELMDLITPYTLEVNKKVLNLPEKVYKTIPITATLEQRRLFAKVLTGVGTGPMIKVQNVLEKMLRLQQIIGGFEPQTTETINEETGEPIYNTITVPLAENPKLDALMEMLDDHHRGSKFIIWARYIPEIQLLVAALEKRFGPGSTVAYYGATSAEGRAEAQDRYCGDPRCRFFVGNPAAAGLGLTLISGENDVMVYYSGTFAYIDRAQSEDRAHRIGQRNSVVVVDFVMENSLDEAIQAAIAAKTDVDSFVKDWINRSVAAEGRFFSEEGLAQALTA